MPDETVVRVPQVNVNDASVKLVSWLARAGQRVEPSQAIALVETSKTTVEIEAPAAGYLHFTHAPGDELAVGDVLCRLSSAPGDATEQAPFAGAGGIAADGTGAPRFSRRAQELVKEHGLAHERFAGKGLVRERDVLEMLGKAAAPAPVAAPMPPPPETRVPFRRELLSRRKRLEAKLLTASYFSAVASSVTVACPTRGFRAAVARQPVVRSLPAAVFVHEAARLLRQFPVFNSFYDDGHVCYYEPVHVGFAVDAGRGLKVVVVRDADTKPLGEIAGELTTLLEQYVEERLPVGALADGTFTITDLGGEAAVSFQPLIFPRQAAILGIGAEWFADGRGEGAFNLVLTFDHRLAEGRTAARFLGALRERLRAYEAASRPAGDGRSCARCLRSVDEIRDLDGFLVPSAHPAGYLCSFCLSGL